jgi:cathepsin B
MYSIGSEMYTLPSESVTNMQREIMNNGPVVAEMTVYLDFKNYQGSAVYVQKLGADTRTGHAIKIIGWGVEKGVPYWTIINSWGKMW